MNSEWEAPRLPQAIRGDVTALTHLLTATRHRLRASVARRIPNWLQALIDPEDVVQEAHFQAFKRLGSVHAADATTFYRWLWRVARNRLADLVKWHGAARRGGNVQRAHGRLRSTTDHDSLSVVLDILASSSASPSRVARAHEAELLLQNAVRKLPTVQGWALRRVYLEGVPVATAACESGRTPDAVRALCRRGLAAVRETLGSASRILEG